MLKRALVLLFPVAICIALAPAAQAHDRPPRVKLHVDDEVRAIGSWTYTWNHGSGGGACGSIHADGIPNYEPRASVDSLHATPRLFFLRDQQPRVESFRAYSQLDEHGWVTGSSERVDGRLSRVRRNGELVAWKLRFHTEVVDERYFDLTVSFARQGRCGDNGGASYAFGLERE